jgi:hypothetical protein
MAHRNPVGGRASSRRLCWLGVSVVVGIVYSGRADREVGGCIDRIGGVDQCEGGSGRVGDPCDSPRFGVVGINVHPAAQRDDPTGRRVSADLRFYLTVRDPVRSAVRGRSALVSHVVVGCCIVATG